MVLNKFFTHSGINVKWWLPAKWTFILSIICLFIVAGSAISEEQKQTKKITFELWVPGMFACVFCFYISTLTASCLKASKCSILAFFQILSPVILLCALGVYVFIQSQKYYKQLAD
tara:strand:+ start:862 stop:1209 length:348 start_codon:yes stop_codon:yes gene_type:complete